MLTVRTYANFAGDAYVTSVDKYCPISLYCAVFDSSGPGFRRFRTINPEFPARNRAVFANPVSPFLPISLFYPPLKSHCFS